MSGAIFGLHFQAVYSGFKSVVSGKIKLGNNEKHVQCRGQAEKGTFKGIKKISVTAWIKQTQKENEFLD